MTRAVSLIWRRAPCLHGLGSATLRGKSLILPAEVFKQQPTENNTFADLFTGGCAARSLPILDNYDIITFVSSTGKDAGWCRRSTNVTRGKAI